MIGLLRFLTCGNVDDGKSTLIGRLLYDSKAVQVDLLEAIQKASKRNGQNNLDLALLSDGLKFEREQGITIDVAYKYFNTPQRKFIIADTPGHTQYTRNMVTGASTAQLAIILIDARHGIVEQTRRHSYIVNLLRIPHIVLAINKMDLVNYDEECFNKIRNDFENLLNNLHCISNDVQAIPLVALEGDNVVHNSDKIPWYKGPTLLHYLENVKIENDENLEAVRFPIQTVIRPQTRELPDYRAYAGTLSSGILHAGDNIQVLASGKKTSVERIEFAGKEIDEAFPPMSISVLLKEKIDISRGDMLVSVDKPPVAQQEYLADLCWMVEEPLQVNGKYILRQTSRQIQVIISEIQYRINIQDPLLSTQSSSQFNALELNDIARIRFKSREPLYFDAYTKNRRTGSFILIDNSNFMTVAAGMLLEGS